MQYTNWYILIAILASFILLSLGTYRAKKEAFMKMDDMRSKCYSCEKQYPAGYEWMGQKSRCFDCESQLFAMSQGLPHSIFDNEPVRFSSLPKLGYVS